jgi:hypothetical protein
MVVRARPFAAVLVSLASCAGGDTQFHVEYADGFRPHGAAVSVFGVYKDGRMSPESWEELAPKLAAITGDVRCAAVVDAAFVKKDAALFSAVDDFARDNGVTDDLLAAFAPASAGDVILTIAVAGKYARAAPAASASLPAPTSLPPSRRGGRGRRRASAPAERARAERNELEMSATLFSVSQRRSVASVEMKYTGTSGDEAVTEFVAKLRETMSGSTCAGWKNDVHPDEERIRTMPEP